MSTSFRLTDGIVKINGAQFYGDYAILDFSEFPNMAEGDVGPMTIDTGNGTSLNMGQWRVYRVDRVGDIWYVRAERL